MPAHYGCNYKPYFEQALAISPGHEITEEYLMMTIHFLNEQTGLQ